MSQKLSSVVTSTAIPRRPRKQYSCLECQRRKQKCVFKEPGAQCQHCARRFPPVECVRTGSRAPQELQVTVFPVGKQVETPTQAPKTKVITPRSISIRQQSSRRTSEDSGYGADLAEEQEDSQPPNFALAVRPKKPTILDGRRDGYISPPNWAHLGGILDEVGTTLNAFPLEMTFENAELFHYYIRCVIPNMVSIDGQTEPVVWKTNVLPWQLQSPLYPHIAILMAAVTMGLERGTMTNTFALKANALKCINAHLASSTPETFQSVAVDLTGCIVSMVVMEWFWGTEESMRAHQRGIKEVLRLCGGISGMQDPVKTSIMLMTDYEIACGFEEDLSWQQGDPMYKQAWITPASWPQGFDSPLVESAKAFSWIDAELGIDSSSAAILDDVRFLTISITSLSADTAASRIKIQTTASWLHDRLRRASKCVKGKTEDAFTRVIRLAAHVWSYSIMTLTPFAKYPNKSVLLALSEACLLVPLSRWKDIPGIYLWVLLALCPSTQADLRGKYIRRKMATTGLAIGFEDFVYSIGCFRACWKVQRWIAAGGSCRYWLADQISE